MKSILLSLLLSYVVLCNGNPIISNVTIFPSNGQVSIHSKVEISFNLNQYSNPFDENVINTYVEFWSPSGRYFKVYGFFNRQYGRSLYQCQANPDLTECTTCETFNYLFNNWKIRFTPDQVGTWSYRIVVEDEFASTQFPINGLNTFQCLTSANNHGFIIKANNKYLKKTTGQFVFPIGSNVPWALFPQPENGNEYGTNDYYHHIDSISKYGGNYIRVWLDFRPGFSLFGHELTNDSIYGFDNYNLKDAQQLDMVIEYAKTKNVNILLTLFTHASWGLGGYCVWNDNPYNSSNGGPISNPYNFFSNINADNYTRSYLKYCISRWGYATNILAWELWNEVDQIQFACNSANTSNPPPVIYPVPTTYFDDLIDWHSTMSSYIRDIDPFNHLITTSFAGCFKQNERGILDHVEDIMVNMDFFQTHEYSMSGNNHQHALFDVKTIFDESSLNKPFLIGEWYKENIQSEDPFGINFHNSLWSSCFSTTGSSITNWAWDSYLFNRKLWNRFQPMSVFMSTQSIFSQDFVPKEISSVNGLRVYYMHNNSSYDTIHGWAQDIAFHIFNLAQSENGSNYIQSLDQIWKPNPTSSNNSINIYVPNDGDQYLVNWFNSQTGLPFSSSTVFSNNNILTFSIPLTLRTSTFGDGVFKLLNCEKFIWREGYLNSTSPGNVNNNIVTNKATGQVFYRNSNSKIESLVWNSGLNIWQHSTLNNATSSVNVAGDLSLNNNGTQLFFRTTDGKLKSIKYDTGCQCWLLDHLNYCANSSVLGPIISGANDYVFYRTSTNGLKAIKKINGTWVIDNLNNSATSNVGDAIDVNLINNQVFFKTLNYKLNSIYISSGGTWSFSNLNNAANNNVCGNITVNNAGHVFFRTCDNKMNNIWYNGSNNSWSLSNLNNSAVNVGGNVIADFSGWGNKVFYRTVNNDINCIYYENNQWNNSNLNNVTVLNKASNCSMGIDLSGNVYYKSGDNKVHRLYYKSQCFDTPAENFHMMIVKGKENDIIENFAIENDLTSDISVFPNPASNKIDIKVNSSIKSIILFDIRGVKVIQVDGIDSFKYNINASGLRRGLYLIKVICHNGQHLSEKIIID